MNYELPNFSIDRTDFLKGGNSFDTLPDGGVQKSYYGYNSFYKPGVVTVSPLLSDSSSTIKSLTAFSFAYGNIVGSTPVGLAMGSDGTDGYYYAIAPTTGVLTKVGATDAARSYSKIVTDTIWYNSAFFTTCVGQITKNSADLATRDLTWWTTTKGMTALSSSAIPHPMVVFGDIMYIADGRYVHQNDNDTCQYNVLDFAAGWVITSMVVHNNMIYMTVYQYDDNTGTYHGRGKMVTWDGVATSWIGEWPLDYRVNAMYVFDQTLYMWTNKWMGYWDGFRMKRLYPMSGLILKHQITSTSDSMFFVDPASTNIIVRMGAPSIVGATRFHRYINPTATVFNGISAPYDDALIVTQYGASAATGYFVSNVNTPGSTNSFAWKFNRRRFSRPVKIRGIVIELADTLASGQSVNVQYVDDTGTLVTTTAIMTYSTVAHRTKLLWRFDIIGHKAVNFVEPYITVTGGALLANVDYLYEPVDWMNNA